MILLIDEEETSPEGLENLCHHFIEIDIAAMGFFLCGRPAEGIKNCQ
jgi:hypothetical protein